MKAPSANFQAPEKRQTSNTNGHTRTAAMSAGLAAALIVRATRGNISMLPDPIPRCGWSSTQPRSFAGAGTDSVLVAVRRSCPRRLAAQRSVSNSARGVIHSVRYYAGGDGAGAPSLPKSESANWCLVFGISLDVGAWYLELFHSRPDISHLFL